MTPPHLAERPDAARPRPSGQDPVTAFLIPFWPTDRGSNGIVTYVDNLTRRLRERGGRPVLITDRKHLGADRIESPPIKSFTTEAGSRVLRKLKRMAARVIPPLRVDDPTAVAIAAAVEDCVRRDGVQLL